MGKCVAGGYTPYFEKTVCDGCLHKDVCGNSDYLTENSCSDKIECSLAHLRELLAAAKEGRLVALSEPMVSLMVSDDDNDSDVYCPKCDIETPMFYDANGAVKAWNRRAKRTGRWVPVVNTWTQDEHEYGATWYKCDQCGRLCETKQPYCHCGAHMIEGEEHD